MNDKINDAKKNMEKGIEFFKAELSKLRVGRATTHLVEGIKVEAYGSPMGLKEVAALTVPDAKTLSIQPWDRSLIGEIEKAILAANLGLTPANDGNTIRLNMPPMTEERRKEFVKQIKKMGEDSKVSIRNIRRDSIDGMKKQDASEDESRRFENEIQKLTDHFSHEVDRLVESKSKEVMTL